MAGNVYEKFEGAAFQQLSRVGGNYQRHEPEKTVLYQLVADEFNTFRDRCFEFGDTCNGLPKFVLDEFERYLKCGILAHGFARVRCQHCHDEILVGFSCKGRGLCPSCGARRMHDTAAHLVDRVLPYVPYRQWVLSFPKWLRPLLARAPCLMTAMQNILLASIFVWQRKKIREKGIRHIKKLGVGAVLFSQRFGDSLNLNVHFHVVLPDGVFIRDDNNKAIFQPIPSPKEEDIYKIATRIVRRIRCLLEKLGLLRSQNITDEDLNTMDILAKLLPFPALRILLSHKARLLLLYHVVAFFAPPHTLMPDQPLHLRQSSAITTS